MMKNNFCHITDADKNEIILAHAGTKDSLSGKPVRSAA